MHTCPLEKLHKGKGFVWQRWDAQSKMGERRNKGKASVKSEDCAQEKRERWEGFQDKKNRVKQIRGLDGADRMDRTERAE